MILTIPVLLYQLFFVLLMLLANRIGHKTGVLALVLCLLWTATHIFLLPLAVLQAVVIIASWWFTRRGQKA